MKRLIFATVVLLAACGQTTVTDYSPTGDTPVSLPSRWQNFSRNGSIVTMPNGCQWIHWSAPYNGAAMTPYTGPDGRQVCVEPLQ